MSIIKKQIGEHTRLGQPHGCEKSFPRPKTHPNSNQEDLPASCTALQEKRERPWMLSCYQQTIQKYVSCSLIFESKGRRRHPNTHSQPFWCPGPLRITQCKKVEEHSKDESYYCQVVEEVSASTTTAFVLHPLGKDGCTKCAVALLRVCF